MDTKIMRRAGAIGVGLLLAGSVGTTAQEPVGGYTWEPFEPVRGQEEIRIDSVTELPNGRLIAFGSGYWNSDGPWLGIVWSSDDDGQTWTRKKLDDAFIGIDAAVAHGDQLVVARPRDGRRATWIFTSPDGKDWDVAAKLKDVEVQDLISTPDGLAMLGLDFRKAKGFGKRLAGYPTLWLSDDAVDWEAHEITSPIYDKSFDEPQALQAIARSDDGTWMAAGRVAKFDRRSETSEVRPSIWSAGADLEWAEVTAPIPTEGSQNLDMLLLDSTPDGFLFSSGRAAPPENNEHGLWLTPDGQDWEQVADTAAPGIWLAVSNGSGVIGWQPAFTGDLDDDQLLPGSPMYVSSDGRSWENPTPHMLDIHVVDATAMPDGRLLIAGRDISTCDEGMASCLFFLDGSWIPVVLIGTPA